MTPRDPAPRSLPGAHLFADESKERDSVLVAAVIAPPDLATIRALTRSLIYRGQATLHMKKESEPRKRFIADSGVQAVVYTADRSNDELTARAACLNALVADAPPMGGYRLVFERDDSLIRWDNQRLIELTRQPSRAAILANSIEENDRLPFKARESASGVIPMAFNMLRWLGTGVRFDMQGARGFRHPSLSITPRCVTPLGKSIVAVDVTTRISSENTPGARSGTVEMVRDTS